MTTPQTTLSIIVAIADDRVIGRGGDQPFYIRDDLRRFKALTLGHPVIMGRRTFEALPRGPLPGRTNIVVTRDPHYTRDGITVAGDIDSAMAAAADAPDSDETFIIGGGQLYDAFMPHADRIYLTRIYASVPDGDTRFPAIDPTRWHEADRTPLLTDPATGLQYHHITLTRKKANHSKNTK